jgi:hypothetical protein
MACFLVMTKNDFNMMKSSWTNSSSFGKVKYLSQTTRGMFIQVEGQSKADIKQLAREIRDRYPDTVVGQQNLHHVIP